MTKWPLPIDHTYILCSPQKEPERAEYLQGWLRSQTIDPSCYTMELYCYGNELSIGDCARYHNPNYPRAPVSYVDCTRGIDSGNTHYLKPSVISLGVNWAAAARKAVHAGHSVVMMLESDVLFPEGFMDKLKGAMDQLGERPWDFLSLSASSDLYPHRVPGSPDGWFPAHPYYSTRTTDAMIFKVSMLEKILTTFFPFKDIIDWELNYQLSLHKAVALWLDPPIIRQGSGHEYPTTLV